jgi:nucleoside-diphosphate-sugar epimerase
MRVLFIGGTGLISSACSQLAVERGLDLYLVNRGESQRPAPDGAHLIRADVRAAGALKDTLQGFSFDAVVDWIAYTPDQVQADIEFFSGRTDQFVFISSASVYQKPPMSLPITESTVLDNPFWEYAQNKIACEEALIRAYRKARFPATIVRPSHTYDCMSLPVHGGWTFIDRLRKGKPVVVHGDGSSLWTLTHHADFAKGFVGLLGNGHAVGESFHVTSDEILTWNQIHESLAHAAGAKARLVHVASDRIARYDSRWGVSLLGDKAHSAIFDNTKIKRAVPGFAATVSFAQGAQEIIDWYDADPARQVVDRQFDLLIDRIVADEEAGRPMK